MSGGPTKGPWVFNDISSAREDDGLGYIYQRDWPEGLGPTIAHTGDKHFSAEENRDNARLIAAAPELLEALEAAPLRGRDESPRAFDDRQTAWLRDFFRPAVAKARGQS